MRKRNRSCFKNRKGSKPEVHKFLLMGEHNKPIWSTLHCLKRENLVIAVLNLHIAMKYFGV